MNTSGLSVGTTEVLFLLDPDNDVAYYFKIKSATSISIIKRRMYLKSVSIFENPYSQKALMEEFELDALGTALSMIMMHLSRFCEEIIIWNSMAHSFCACYYFRCGTGING